MSNAILYVFSGAGLSAESGVATFRSAGGIWDKHNLNTVCNALTWKANRSAVFEFYQARRREVAKVAPCDAHLRLAQWQRAYGPDRVRLLTQNVDDLLEQSGARHVTHLHGNLKELQCTACGTQWAADDNGYHEHAACFKCKSLKGVKPAVVFFNESAPEYVHLKRMARDIRPQDVLLVVGTALEVISAEHLIPRRRFGHALNWQVNPHPADIEYFGVNLAEGASRGLLALEPEVHRRLGA